MPAGLCIHIFNLLKAQSRAMGNELFNNAKTFTCQDCVKVFEISLVKH
jgi:hypothetical protein